MISVSDPQVDGFEDCRRPPIRNLGHRAAHYSSTVLLYEKCRTSRNLRCLPHDPARTWGAPATVVLLSANRILARYKSLRSQLLPQIASRLLVPKKWAPHALHTGAAHRLTLRDLHTTVPSFHKIPTKHHKRDFKPFWRASDLPSIP